MMVRRSPKFKRRALIFTVCLLAIGGAGVFAHKLKVDRANGTKNYSLVYAAPPGWRAIPHSPQSIFMYRDPRTRLLLRGAMSDVVADFNPTPGMDSDTTAQWMLDRTAENQKDWTGQYLDVVDAKGATFRLIRRSNPRKCVVSAVAVRGNTTIVVTMSADKLQLPYIDGAMPMFRQYLTSLEFRRHVWEN